ncbi:helix-turn-helix domain-containing protein [Arthrobacter sp. AK01]|uniref:helix-turn-helix domain-containing protein n=1 Tax=Arthrobacter sp. AK01 TaxID=2894084 RepID=UPI001E62FA26|nr:helix-turn-helix domain-containing protein [Arthrobacter sp. AK01]MCD4849698.1 helix-turn-helix domain-containing protein [Arthrobacter sp. AK01]
MADFRIGDTLELADGDYLVESMAGGTLRLRNLRSQELNMIHVSAVPRLLALPPVLGPDRPGPRSFDSLPAEVAEGTRTMARHIEEVIYGKPHGEETCREEYDPEHVGLLERQRRKAVELSRLGHPVSERTIRRWVDLYRQSGPAGLVDGRQSRKDVPLGNLDIRVRDALVAAITKATNRSTGTGIRLIHEAKAELLRKYPGEEIPIPSDRSLRRHIGVLTKGKYTAGSAANRRSADNAPKRMFSARPAISPGHEVQIDSSPFDVLARGIDGRPVRAKLTIMLCKATQSIIATSVNVRGVKGVDLAFMLAQCLVPPPPPPGGGGVAHATAQQGLPWWWSVAQRDRTEGHAVGQAPQP